MRPVPEFLRRACPEPWLKKLNLGPMTCQFLGLHLERTSLTSFVMRPVPEFLRRACLKPWLEKLNLGNMVCQFLGLHLDELLVIYS
jgi:hypothetical protein